MGRKRTLADDLADWATTAPTSEADFDRDDLGDDATLLESDDEHEEAPVKKRSRSAPEKALRIRADIGLGSGEYGGKRTTRADAFGSGSELSDGSDEYVESGEEVGNEEDEEPASLSRNSRESREEEEVRGSESDDDEELPSEEAGKSTEQGYEEMQIAEAAALDQVKERIAREEAKGEAARKQQALWDKLLEVRILLQRSLTASQQMPVSGDMGAAKAAAENTIEQLDRVTQEASSSISGLLSLQAALVYQNPAIAAKHPESLGEGGPTGGGQCQELWLRMEASYLQMAAFRNSSLDRWFRKTLVGSGSATLKSNMQLLNQSVSSQVANMMRSSERMISRTQPLLSVAPRHLFSANEGSHPEVEEARDPETFDDSEFYQQLLKEFLETSGGGPQAAGSVVPALSKRKKNLRDRRASKGRRLRYDVQEKLVSFMAPKRDEEPVMASQLFRNLFGHGRVI